MTNNPWTRCNNCQRILYKQDILDNLFVCPACHFHFRLSSEQRLGLLFDDGKYDLVDENIYSVDRLQFEDSQKYSDRLEDNQRKTGKSEAVSTAVGNMGGIKVVVAAMEFAFMGGSMGSVVGEKVTRAAELALRENCPLLVISCSGGARMQEGLLSLMQMMKTSAAVGRLDKTGIPYLSVLTDPTTAGVMASFAMLGDLNIAEPNALIGFTGARVIEQTIKEKLPKGFQRSDFMLKHGFVDDVVDRKKLKPYLVRVLRLLTNRYK